jgi:hypothetical protein
LAIPILAALFFSRFKAVLLVSNGLKNKLFIKKSVINATPVLHISSIGFMQSQASHVIFAACT